MHPYQQVINDVKTINRQAALILARRMPLLLIRKQVDSAEYFNRPHLKQAFFWASTPQGHDYWMNIARRLNP